MTGNQCCDRPVAGNLCWNVMPVSLRVRCEQCHYPGRLWPSVKAVPPGTAAVALIIRDQLSSPLGRSRGLQQWPAAQHLEVTADRAVQPYQDTWKTRKSESLYT